MKPPHAQTEHKATLQFERLVFFSDAVFAIAITLLVLDLKVMPNGHGAFDFSGIGSKLFGFALSFAVIGIYWLMHHKLFGGLRREDGRLLVVNLLFLASVVFLPFPTSVIAEGIPTTGSVIFYAASVAAVGLLLTLLAVVARKPALLLPTETRGGTWRFIVRSLPVPIVFLASIPVAIQHPVWSMLIWWLTAPASWAGQALGRWVEDRVDAPKTVKAGGAAK